MFQGFIDVGSFGISHSFEPFVITDLYVRAQVMSRKAKVYAKTLVAKDSLLFTEDWISELWVKC